MTDDRHTDDLERDLREMLTERSRDIRAVPAELLVLDAPRSDAEAEGDADVIDLAPRLGDVLTAARRRWPLLVAAAVLLGSVGGVLALLAGPAHHQVPPAHHPVKVRTVIRPACRAAVPASWKRAIAGSPSVRHVDAQDVQAVTSSGGLVLQYSTGAPNRQRFAYLAPGAASPRSLGTFRAPVPNGHPGAYQFDVDTDGSTLLVTTESGVRTTSPREITAVDLRTGRHTVLADVRQDASRRIFGQAYVLDGTAYWETLPSVMTKGSATHAAIVSRSVTGGPSRVVARGSLYLEKSALGIEWNTYEAAPDRPAAVPSVVARHANIDSEPNEVFDSYISDGSVYAWQTLQGALDWFDPSTGELVSVPHLLGVPGVAPGQAVLLSVAGPLVYYQNQRGTGDLVIDVRTGAVVNDTQEGELYGAGGTLVGDRSAFNRSGEASSLFTIRATDLPPARC